MLSIPRLVFLFFFVTGIQFVQAQETVTSIPKDTVYTLRNDTLFGKAGFYLTKGQTLRIGKGSGQNGWFRFIGFKSSMAWPVLLFHDAEINQMYKDSADPETARTNDLIKQSLDSGKVMLVTEIKRKGGKRTGYAYRVAMKEMVFPRTGFYCYDILSAIWSKEVIVDVKPVTAGYK